MKTNNIVFTKLGVNKDTAPIMSHTQGELTQMTFVPSENGDYMIKIPESAGFKMAMPRSGIGMNLTPYYANSNQTKEYVGVDYSPFVDTDGQEYTVNGFFVNNTPDDLYLIIQVENYTEGSSATLYFVDEEVYEPNTQETAYMVSPASHGNWDDEYYLRIANASADDSVWFVFDADYAQDIEAVYAMTGYPGIALKVYDTYGFSSGLVDENYFYDEDYDPGALISGSNSYYSVDGEEILSGLTGLIYVEVIVQNTDEEYPSLIISQTEHIPFTMSRADFFARAGKPLDYSIASTEASVTAAQLENLLAQQTADLSDKVALIENSIESNREVLIENTERLMEIIPINLATAPATEAVLLLKRLLALTEGLTEPGTAGNTDNVSVAVISESGEVIQDIRVEGSSRTPTKHMLVDKTGAIPAPRISIVIGEKEEYNAVIATVIADAPVFPLDELPPQPEPPEPEPEPYGTVVTSNIRSNTSSSILCFLWEGGAISGRALNMPIGVDLDLELYSSTNGSLTAWIFNNHDSSYSDSPRPLMPRFDLTLPAGEYVVGIGADNMDALLGAESISFEFSAMVEMVGSPYQPLDDITSISHNATIEYRSELDPINQ